VTAPDDTLTDFAGLALREELVSALGALGYEEPTPIQREAIPPLLAGKDLLGQAATGTGKTAAFALPMLQGLEKRGRGSAPVCLVLAPTRELAMQVSEATHRYGKDLFGTADGARVLPVYGGQPIGGSCASWTAAWTSSSAPPAGSSTTSTAAR
jgi:ATP-dependent RNA helicase DeaD